MGEPSFGILGEIRIFFNPFHMLSKLKQNFFPVEHVCCSDVVEIPRFYLSRLFYFSCLVPIYCLKLGYHTLTSNHSGMTRNGNTFEQI